MTIIVFLIDTSASMNQRIYLGGRPTLLDVAKSAVEYFVKVRQRSVESRGDRYMLLTFEDPPHNIKAGWKENLQTFTTELKNLQATGLTNLGQALRHTFDVLNVNRMQHGIDTYGQGRCPFYLEPSIIVVITDGGRLSSNAGVSDELKLHGSSPGAELTREPFRWDQRLFGLVLKMSSIPSNSERETGLVPPDDSPIELMCDATGGRSYAITTHRMLHQCIESIAQKVQAGVVLHFEKYGPDPVLTGNENKEDGEDTRWHSTRRMIFVPRSAQKTGFAGGFWPIPEAFWPDTNVPSLPPRSAHPNVKFLCQSIEPLAIENFPFDKYELEPNPLTQYVLARKQPNTCWQVFLPNSSRANGLGHAFGYLKASTNLTCVNLFVMPYNYPMLLPLLQDLLQIYRLKPPNNEWRSQFGLYMSTIPPYYLSPLKRALSRIGATSIVPNISEETYLSYSVLNYLKKLKSQAKVEYERTCAEVGSRVQSKEILPSASSVKRINLFKNPFDVPRDQLLDHLCKLRSHFFRPFTYLQATESLHNQPVSQMGNYQEYLKRMPTPLREIESTPVRQHMFGNPFKIDKRIVIDKIDEADLDPIVGTVEDGSATPTRKLKRKPGPLPKGYHFIPNKNRLPYAPEEMFEDSPTSSPAASPTYEFAPDDLGPSLLFHPLPNPVTPISGGPMTMESDHTHIGSPVVTMLLNREPTPSPSLIEESLHFLEEDSIIPPPTENGLTNGVDESDEEEEEEETEAEGRRRNLLVEDEQVEMALQRRQEEERVWKTNFEIRAELHKEIRRPIVRMEYMLEQLSSIAGSVETKRKFIKGLEFEALRFKRRKLAKVLEDEQGKLEG